METLYMETTKKSPEQTSAEIESLLIKYGLSRFMKEYKNGEVVGCIFSIRLDDKDVPINLPVNWRPLLQLANEGRTKYIKDELQAQRVAWRQVLRWIEAQLALVDIGMVEMQEVFLPYVMVNKNQTMYQMIKEKGFQLIEFKEDV